MVTTSKTWQICRGWKLLEICRPSVALLGRCCYPTPNLTVQTQRPKRARIRSHLLEMMHHQAVWKSTVVRRLEHRCWIRRLIAPHVFLAYVYGVEATTANFADFTVSLQTLLYLKQFQDCHGKTSSSNQRDARNVLAAAARQRFIISHHVCAVGLPTVSFAFRRRPSNGSPQQFVYISPTRMCRQCRHENDTSPTTKIQVGRPSDAEYHELIWYPVRFLRLPMTRHSSLNPRSY